MLAGKTVTVNYGDSTVKMCVGNDWPKMSPDEVEGALRELIGGVTALDVIDVQRNTIQRFIKALDWTRKVFEEFGGQEPAIKEINAIVADIEKCQSFWLKFRGKLEPSPEEVAARENRSKLY